MTKKFILGFNWKLNPNTYLEAENLLKSYQIPTQNIENIEVLVFPPNLFLYPLQSLSLQDNLNLNLGSQDVSRGEEGAFTAEISAKQLLDSEVKWVLIGHSETRELRKMSNLEANQKTKTALKNNLSVIFCVGYQEEKSNSNLNYFELKQQILEGLEGVFEMSQNMQIILAYEPIWAIGSGKAATKQIIAEVLEFLKTEIGLIFGVEAAKKVIFLYGGSVNEENAADLASIPNLDGFLIGGASLVPEKVEKIIKSVSSL